MILTKYSEKDYQGRFNLKVSEKKLVTSALKRTKETQKLSKLLRKPELDVVVAILKHDIPLAD